MYRIGHGYDAHRFSSGRSLVLGGADIPYQRGLLGHSDADALTHALIDAILGSLGLGDIGTHFPDSEAEYENIKSLRLLERTAGLMARRGYVLVNADCTIIAQQPKLSPYIGEMRENLARALRCETRRINVKATTEEGLGFTGALEGICAHAVVILKKNATLSPL